MAVLQRLLPVLVVAGLLIAVLLARPPLPVPARLGAVARSTRGWRLAGLVVGLVAAAWSASSSALGRGLLLAVPLLCLCVLLGVVVGELGVRPTATDRRSAALEVRRARSYLPRFLTPLVAAATLLLGALLVFASAVGSADDLGRAGRALTRACSAVSGQSSGPWPGTFYALPLGAVVVSGVLVAAVALTSITRRPRQGEDPEVDDELRRHAARGVVAAVGLLVTVPLVGTGLLAASQLLRICAAPPAWTAVGWTLVLVVPLALGLGTWCAALLLVPGTVRTAVPVAR